ncbi:MAG: glycosyltransferase [Candidatus Bathyarchaeia archaeon]
MASTLFYLEATSKYVVTIDADYSHDPREMPRLLQQAKRGCDIVVGSRIPQRRNC